MDPTVAYVTTLRMMRDYQQTIDSLLARIAELEAQVQAQQHINGVVHAPEEAKDAAQA